MDFFRPVGDTIQAVDRSRQRPGSERMPEYYQHLDTYSDWVEQARRQSDLYPIAAPYLAFRRSAKCGEYWGIVMDQKYLWTYASSIGGSGMV